MADKKHSPLGKGLASLIRPKAEKSWGSPAAAAPQTEGASGLQMVQELPLDQIDPNRSQPRGIFDLEALKELAESVRQHGVLEPLIVTFDHEKKRYELVAGERRLRAAKMAGLETVPVLVRSAGELERLELALIENLQREDLNPIEEAEAYVMLMDNFSLTQEEVARRVGKSRVAVANTLRLLKLPSDVQAALASRQVSAGHARALLSLPSEELQREFLKRILKEQLTVRDVESDARAHAKRQQKRRDPAIAEYERRLREALGTRVDVQKTPNGGRVVIGFYADEELRHIVEQIAGELE